MTLDPITGLLLLIGFDILLTIAVLDAVLRLQRKPKSRGVMQTKVEDGSMIYWLDAFAPGGMQRRAQMAEVERNKAAAMADTNTGDVSRPRNHDPLVDPDPEVSAHMDQHIRCGDD